MIVEDYLLENQDEEVMFEDLYGTEDHYGVMEVFDEAELDPENEKLRIPGEMLSNGFRRKKRKLQEFVSDLKSEMAYESGRRSSQQERIEAAGEREFEDLEDEIDEVDRWVKRSNYAVAGSLGGIALFPSMGMKLASGVGGLGAAVFGDYKRGERDEKIEKAVKGLEEAYGDYSVEVDPEVEYSGAENISEEVGRILSGQEV
jgi:hypothetical protein